jgi:hypothetical protein
VIAATAAAEQNPERKRRLESFAETVRELGVATAGDVLARAFTGGLG